ncbi:MAG: hypothetical protein WB561_12660 [Terracidiphilus sp.]
MNTGKNLQKHSPLVFVALVVTTVPPSSIGQVAEPGSIKNSPASGPSSPANVPDGFVITPFGYFDPSCVQSLLKGEKLLSDGRLQREDGTTAETVAVCNYPHYNRSGIRISSTTGTATPREKNSVVTNISPEINGWIEDESITTGSPTEAYGAMFATWKVPPQPSANDGQVLYFFPGFEDINDSQTSILQPVLQWYQDQWSLASWNCCINGVVTNSPSVNVSPGDEIYGSITSSCLPGTLSCATWNVLSLDLSTGESTTLGDTPSEGQIFNWAFGGVLEPYYVISCDDYPADRHITFENITVFDQNLHPVHAKFSGSSNSTETPQCNYGVKGTKDTVRLDY